VSNIVNVRHITKNHVRIVTAPGYSVVVFNIADGSVEAIVAADDGSETVRLKVEAPEPGLRLGIKNIDPHMTDLIYQPKEV
jgi:hypothetical protein